MAKTFIEEFLYRGQPDGTGSWHVVLGAAVSDGLGGKTITTSLPMTPEAAAEKGHQVADIVAGLNAGVMAALEAEKAARAADKVAAQAALEEAVAGKDSAIAAIEADSARKIHALEMERQQLKASVDAVTAGSARVMEENRAATQEAMADRDRAHQATLDTLRGDHMAAITRLEAERSAWMVQAQTAGARAPVQAESEAS